MENITNVFSWFKKNAGNTLTNLKNRSQKFKEKFKEAKSQPKSKRKSLFLGFTTVLGIFGITLLTPVLPAVAKDIPKQGPGGGPPANPPATPPAVTPITTSAEIAKGVAGIAGAIWDLAVSSGSFAIGVAVVYGILKAQGK